VISAESKSSQRVVRLCCLSLRPSVGKVQQKREEENVREEEKYILLFAQLSNHHHWQSSSRKGRKKTRVQRRLCKEASAAATKFACLCVW
jgi:hypothetical protein